MNKYHSPATTENEVWLTGQVFAMQSETITKAMDQTPNDLFGVCILILNRGHIGAALGFGMDIHKAGTQAAEDLDLTFKRQPFLLLRIWVAKTFMI
jgi:hypothetical protein